MILALLLVLAPPVQAQDFTALARLDAGASRIERGEDGGLTLTLALSQVVPWRIFTLDAPRRLGVDFSELDWRGVDPETLGDGVRIVTLRPGWSRLTLPLAAPLRLLSAQMAEDAGDHSARLVAVLVPGDAADFAARAGAPSDPGPDARLQPGVTPAPAPDAGPPVIAIDPGHGGIDPGAEREGLSEADLMLALARELAESVNRSGRLRAVLTRDGDDFVPLQTRMTLARAAGAVALVSLHADALEEDAARGASIYTLTAEAQAGASARLAERHDGADLLAGVDLTDAGDAIATALMDLARQETAPRSDRLAAALVAGLRDAGARLNSHPRRAAQLAVLEAADFASVLVETGFLSDDRDRAVLSTAEGRAVLVAGITAALETWLDGEARLAGG
ncbi:MAG: N-acetylmuramoyl-L-alanine amidase [Rubellimicrobium sp.]|nr:N-acetylmuramoyl-L-alanine amidase [Rubellimicrobium sp.]